MSNVGLKDVFKQIQSYSKSELAKEKILNLQPFDDKSAASSQIKKILDFKKLIAEEALTFQLTGLDPASSWLRKVKKDQVLQTLDLNDIRLFLEDAEDLKNKLQPYSKINTISLLLKNIFETKDILSYIQVVVSPSGEINSDASEDLFKFYQEKKNLNIQVQNSLKKIVKDQELEHVLQDRFVTTREGRLVIPIVSGMRHDFKGIIHDHSHTKQTVFMEPEQVIPLNNKITELESKINDEIERILREISHYIHLKYQDLEQCYESLLEIDVFYSLGFFSLITELSPFEWSDSPEIVLPELKHPLLKLELKDVVGNTVELNEKNRILILSGPNAGGKTVLLKSIGLAAQMAMYGLPICCQTGAKIPFFKSIFISLGDEQDLTQNLSSFGGHLIKLNQATHLKGFDHLVLIDEICGTTEAQEGSALARSFIDEYKNNKIFAVITSHLAPLRSHWSEGVINGSMQYNTETQSPSYNFILGLAGESMALPTAKRYNVSDTILKRALNYLTPESQKKFSGLEEIEDLKTKLLSLQNQYQTKLKDLEKKEAQFLIEKNKLEDIKSHKLAEDLNQHQKKIEELIKYEKIKSDFDNAKNLKAIKDQMPKIIKYNSEEQTTQITPENFESKYPPGTSVFIRSLNRKGVIQGKLNSKNEVPVLSESMRIQIHYLDVLPSSGSTAPKNPKTLYGSMVNSQTTETFQKNLDLRGLSIDEALDQLDLEVDQAVQQGLLKIKIIHGHGEQDKLKKSVRTYLSRNTFIKSWLSGKAFGENDGITFAEILS